MDILKTVAWHTTLFLLAASFSGAAVLLVSIGDWHWECVAKCEPYEIQYENHLGSICICEEDWYDGDGFKQAMRANRRGVGGQQSLRR